MHAGHHMAFTPASAAAAAAGDVLRGVVGNVSRWASKSGNARLTAPKKATMMYASTTEGGMPRRVASACTIGHATVTHRSRMLVHHQPAGASHTSTYASTKRFGGSGCTA